MAGWDRHYSRIPGFYQGQKSFTPLEKISKKLLEKISMESIVASGKRGKKSPRSSLVKISIGISCLCS
jgi:hypothetical protein